MFSIKIIDWISLDFKLLYFCKYSFDVQGLGLVIEYKLLHRNRNIEDFFFKWLSLKHLRFWALQKLLVKYTMDVQGLGFVAQYRLLPSFPGAASTAISF